MSLSNVTLSAEDIFTNNVQMQWHSSSLPPKKDKKILTTLSRRYNVKDVYSDNSNVLTVELELKPTQSSRSAQ
jgi:hypothetical protein